MNGGLPVTLIVLVAGSEEVETVSVARANLRRCEHWSFTSVLQPEGGGQLVMLVQRYEEN